MELERLKLFKDIAQNRSVSKAAGLNGISQSAVSQYIQELEEQLGRLCWTRTTRPLTVTEAGKLYLEMCRERLRRREEFQVALDQLKGQVEGTVRVASIYSVGLSELSRLEKEFSRALSAGAAGSGVSAAGEGVGGRGDGSRRPGADELSGAEQGSHGATLARRADGGGGVAVSSRWLRDRESCRRIWKAWISSVSTKTCRFGETSTASCASAMCT